MLFQRSSSEVAWVPSLWWVEVSNALQMGMRRKRFSREERDGHLADLTRLSIATDRELAHGTPSAALLLSDRYNLTIYDAACLELADRRQLPLATLDRELRAAAAVEGVALLGA